MKQMLIGGSIMEETVQQPVRRRRKVKLAPWEIALRRYWPPVRLGLALLIVLLLLVLIISVIVGIFI
jgi:hypothetical protein